MIVPLFCILIHPVLVEDGKSVEQIPFGLRITAQRYLFLLIPQILYQNFFDLNIPHPPISLFLTVYVVISSVLTVENMLFMKKEKKLKML